MCSFFPLFFSCQNLQEITISYENTEGIKVFEKDEDVPNSYENIKKMEVFLGTAKDRPQRKKKDPPKKKK